ncbi:GtrA family protein [Candidatus Saccharibacteria bacterium]|nr:GtrA family protein [Candidatus Saccharibacteria bacterium]
MYSLNKIPKLAKYLITGATAFAVEYSSFLLIIGITPGAGLGIAQTTSFTLGLFTSFLGSRLFTFQNNARPYHHDRRIQLLSYALLAFINLILTNVIMSILIHGFNFDHWLAKLIVMGSLVVWNYVILNRLIFKTS